ncbi:D-alanyl-D-alanine dipeptidase [Chitinophaga skermanii]|uniref:D-alanyl-D-alanine dipeptidase n=1 Tax=Chitinophaga skermanii TaxID=331697 RepID=A0A327QDU8_9BACT|nr:M15 family metallopeptidase [Chitinophaga skermanii]RAJ02491.1 D-alanyl-D-alanine dipeptidase [Chitinophaga skermanii]
MKNLLFLCFLCCAGVLRAQEMPTNKYGLAVVEKEADYMRMVKADTNMLMVNLSHFIPSIAKDIRYATKHNFTKQVLYQHTAIYLRLPAAKALRTVQQELAQHGLGLLIYDAYRPYSVTEKMWEIVPDDRYAADPKKGSGHNRGTAVDLTLIDLKTKKPLPMPTDFDDFSEKAHQDYILQDSTIAKNRALLRNVMEKNGFKGLSTEWWHFYLPNQAQFPLMNIDFRPTK